jgi:hypothetical protein
VSNEDNSVDQDQADSEADSINKDLDESINGD